MKPPGTGSPEPGKEPRDPREGTGKGTWKSSGGTPGSGSGIPKMGKEPPDLWEGTGNREKNLGMLGENSKNREKAGKGPGASSGTPHTIPGFPPKIQPGPRPHPGGFENKIGIKSR